MDTQETIKIPKVDGTTKEWMKISTEDFTQFKNVGFQAEAGYTTTEEPPSVLSGEQVLQNEIIDTGRGDIYILRDSRFNYEFLPIG